MANYNIHLHKQAAPKKERLAGFKLEEWIKVDQEYLNIILIKCFLYFLIYQWLISMPA
jgi:hypothetical protein